MQYPRVSDVQVGDRVYHKGVRANGLVTAIDADKSRDTHKVEFFWAKYVKTIPHGETWNKWMWCEPTNLVKTDWYYRSRFNNKVTSIGGRSLDRLIRYVCEIPRRKRYDNSDIVIVYGQSEHFIPANVFTINRNLIWNKMTQCQIMGEDLAPRVTNDRTCRSYRGWIIKPYMSSCGRNIRPATNEDAGPNEYYQEMFPKVREFRVHCFLWMDEPVQLIQEKHIDDKNQLTWNKKQGGKFRFAYQAGLEDGWENLQYCETLAKSTREMLTKASVEALKRLNYDFGGLDFGMDKFGNLKIFEVNSRMGLLEQTLFTYKRVFRALNTLDINRYEQKKAGWI